MSQYVPYIDIKSVGRKRFRLFSWLIGHTPHPHIIYIYISSDTTNFFFFIGLDVWLR